MKSDCVLTLGDSTDKRYLPISYSMPKFDGIIQNLAKGHIFTSLDLSNKYLQVPLIKEAKDKTAFVTENICNFQRMPFGLHGATVLCISENDR